MTSFFYVVSIAFHTSVPALRKCMDTSRKKIFRLRAQSLVLHLLHLFVGPESLASHHLFERSKDMKVTGGRGLASTADVEDTRRTDLGLLQEINGQYGAEHYVGAKHLYSDVHVVWTSLQDAGDSLGDLHCTGHSVPPGHVVLQIHPSFIPKESQHNLSRRWLCANFFSVLLRRYGAIRCSLSWFPAGGSGPRFHLP